MRFVLVMAVLALSLLFGCATLNSDLSKLVTPQTFDCSDAFTKTQTIMIDILYSPPGSLPSVPCSTLSHSANWNHELGTYRGVNLFCKGRFGSNAGENVKHLYFSDFVISKHAKNVSPDGSILGTDDRVYFVQNLELSPTSDVYRKTGSAAGYQDYQVVSATCKIAQK